MSNSSLPPSPIELYLLTYNCNKQTLRPDLFTSHILEALPDQISSLYVFGFQEFCTILESSFTSEANSKLIKLNELIQSALQEKYQNPSSFQTISMNFLGAIGMIMISPFPSKFQKVRTATSSCGYGYSSLKGAVGFRLTYCPEGRFNSTNKVELSFANLHLNAYEGEYYYLKRNKNLYNLIRSLDFGDGYGLIKPKNHIFIMGDLNYRTSQDYKSYSQESQELFSLSEIPTNDSKYIKKIESLVDNYDELKKSMANGGVLQNFSEANITFRPTYKYHINTAIYNTKRSPSWCDRILYVSSYEEILDDNLGLRLLKTTGAADTKYVESLPYYLPKIKTYSSIDSLLLSDHRPVYLNISIPFNPPKSIISPLSGCLQILPSGLTTSTNFDDFAQLRTLESSTNVVSGPTTVYLIPTKLDGFLNTIVRPIMDLLIGYTLWFGTTTQGRLLLFMIFLLSWSLYYIS
ncbi:uncharacterized protein KGF55_002097 [Candida pseudojiufengensis]|uniref:uncharacterized protein n=1 Tax=Candida pseudojiufengensis TaxID=497109 RepID=UPI00222558EB|nr:uncharacterized protein KGF55_002097 [Candida pseudojiufengensis]KAI5964155.1 hypothetical protein KGF55_002097 [Candida pseudojiufengensis]